MADSKYRELVKTNIPWIERCRTSCGGGISVGTLTLENVDYYRCFGKPYTDVMQKLKDRMDTKGNQHLILVSDDMNLARKTAMLFCLAKYQKKSVLADTVDIWESNGDDPDMLFEIPDDFLEEGEDSDDDGAYTVWQVDYSAAPVEQDMPANRYLLMGDFIHSRQEETDFPVIVEGLFPVGELMQKEAVAALNTETILVLVTEQMAKSSKVEDLIYQYGFTRISLGKMPDGYYESFFGSLLDANLPAKKKAAYLSMFRELKERRRGNLDEETLVLALEEYEKEGLLSKENQKRPASERLDAMTGLSEFRAVACEQVALCVEATKNPKLKVTNRSMVFAGNPGTGKTTCANLLAELAMEKNAGSGVFVSAHRKDMIGKYVGHTAPLIKDLFERARGGILLIDEAGFLIQTGTGDYVKEAVKELVRYMELYPDVTVIFAMYPRECRDFLHMDEGLSSRIARVVHFRDYTDEELLEIFRNMAMEQGYEADDDAMEKAAGFIQALRRGAKDTFGNAREMRKLLAQALGSISMRHMKAIEDGVNDGDDDNAPEMMLTAEDIAFAAERILPKRTGSGSFGFRAAPKTDCPQPKSESVWRDRRLIAASAPV